MVDVVGPSQGVVNEHSEKLKTGDLLNLRAKRWMWRGGGIILALGERISMNLVFSALSFSPLLVIQLLVRSRQDCSEVLRSLQLLERQA